MKGALISLAIGVILLTLLYFKLDIFGGGPTTIDIRFYDTYFVLSYKLVILFIFFILGTFFSIGGVIGSRFKNNIFWLFAIFFISVDTLYAVNAYSVMTNTNANQIKIRDIHDVDKSEYASKLEEEKKIDPQLLEAWKRFVEVATERNYTELGKISLDSIDVCEKRRGFNDFINYCSQNVFDSLLLKRISEISYSHFLHYDEIPSEATEFLRDKKDSSVHLYQFQVLKELTPDGGWTMTFDFAKTKEGYKFFGCDSYGGPDCCQ